MDTNDAVKPDAKTPDTPSTPASAPSAPSPDKAACCGESGGGAF